MMKNINKELKKIFRRDIRDVIEKDSVKYHIFKFTNNDTNIAIHMLNRNPILSFEQALYEHISVSIILNIRNQ